MIAVKKIFAIVLIFAVLASAVILSVDMLTETAGESVYILRAKDNTVALYCGGAIVESYDGISLDTLPVSDRRRLQNGIEFKTASDARRAVEDYDG